MVGLSRMRRVLVLISVICLPLGTVASVGALSRSAVASAYASGPTPVSHGASAQKLVGFGAGVKVVGKDVPPGTYRTHGGDGCYWERLSGFGGTLDQIIANNIAAGPELVTITAADRGFRSTRCRAWSSDLSPITSSPTAPFGEGKYLINQDIAPGAWRASGGEGCYWERLSGFSGEMEEIIANNMANGPAVVTISPTDAGFFSTGCGTWTNVD